MKIRAVTFALLAILTCVKAIGQCDGGGVPTVEGTECPIVLNLTGGGYHLTGAEAPVIFDIHADGVPVSIGWTRGDTDEAFLCLDRNLDGAIDSGAELFGNATRLHDGSRAPNGFVALAELDDNHDSVIDDQDAVWPQLLLWRDLNHDGISQPAEITSVSGSALAAIGLDYHWVGRWDASGNAFRYEAKAWIRNNGGVATPRLVYDIFFTLVR